MLRRGVCFLCVFVSGWCIAAESDTSSVSSDSADGSLLQSSYPKDRLSPFYDINPFAYDLLPYLPGDILESAWRQMFVDFSDPLYEVVLGAVCENGEVLFSIFRNVIQGLEEGGDTDSPLSNEIAQKIRTEIEERFQRICLPTSQDFFNFLGIFGPEDFAIKACKQCFRVDFLEEFYKQVGAWIKQNSKD